MATPVRPIDKMDFEPDERQLLEAARAAVAHAKSEITSLRRQIKANATRVDDEGTKRLTVLFL